MKYDSVKLKSEDKFVNSVLHKCENTEIQSNFGRSFTFADKENKQAFRFYLSKARGDEDRPLFVYLCGSASVGRDNVLNVMEFKTKMPDMKKYNLNILVPQPTVKLFRSILFDGLENDFNAYVDSIAALIDCVCNSYNVDRKRIYIAGTSLGGFCAWRLAYRHNDIPAFFASAVGGFDYKFNENSVEHDFSRYLPIPMWIAHSENDKTVSIRMDDYAYEKLKKAGADITYTRKNRWGHQLSTVFYKKGEWIEKMLSSRR